MFAQKWSVLQQWSLWKTHLYRFSELSAFSADKRWNKKWPLGWCTVKVSPSLYAKIHSGESWDSCNVTPTVTTYTVTALCVSLCIISQISNLMVSFNDSCQSTHTKIPPPPPPKKREKRIHLIILGRGWNYPLKVVKLQDSAVSQGWGYPLEIGEE